MHIVQMTQSCYMHWFDAYEVYMGYWENQRKKQQILHDPWKEEIIVFPFSNFPKFPIKSGGFFIIVLCFEHNKGEPVG